MGSIILRNFYNGINDTGKEEECNKVIFYIKLIIKERLGGDFDEISTGGDRKSNSFNHSR